MICTKGGKWLALGKYYPLPRYYPAVALAHCKTTLLPVDQSTAELKHTCSIVELSTTKTIYKKLQNNVTLH